MAELVAVSMVGLAALPVLMTTVNLCVYRRLKPPMEMGTRRVSVLIPARNEEANIGEAVCSVLMSRDVDLELIVLDDHSSDRTAEIVRSIVEADPRVRLAQAPPLPHGWSGKQHACQVLAGLARTNVLVFIDADVRVAPDGLARMLALMEDRPAGLISGFPRQNTGTLAEKLVVPLITLLLLGYLPMPGLRWTSRPAFGAGCGQLILVRRGAYERTGGHAAIRWSLHDGLALPRAFRRKGLRTDLFDATDLAQCRMYTDAREVWNGFAKNATEGMATPVGLPVWTILLGGGHVLPFLLIGAAAIIELPDVLFEAALLAASLSLGLRFLLTVRFKQSFVGAAFHPLGVLLVLGIQVSALVRALCGIRPVWRGRSCRTS